MTAIAFHARRLAARHPGRRCSHTRTIINAAFLAAGLGLIAGFLLTAAHPRQVQVAPHCLRAQNCVCRELGSWMPGQNKCRDLPAAAGKEHGR